MKEDNKNGLKISHQRIFSKMNKNIKIIVAHSTNKHKNSINNWIITLERDNTFTREQVQSASLMVTRAENNALFNAYYFWRLLHWKKKLQGMHENSKEYLKRKTTLKQSTVIQNDELYFFYSEKMKSRSHLTPTNLWNKHKISF